MFYFSTGGKFRSDYGLLLELHALTLVACSYALLHIYMYNPPLLCIHNCRYCVNLQTVKLTLRKAWKRGYVLSHLARVSLLISKKFTKGGYTLRKSSACMGKRKEGRSVEGRNITKMNNGYDYIGDQFCTRGLSGSS